MILCPGCVRVLGVELSLGVVGLAAEISAQSLLRAPAQTGRNPSHGSGGVPEFLNTTGPSYSWWCWNRCYVLLTSEPMILSVLECLGVELPLGILGPAEEICAQSLLRAPAQTRRNPKPLVGQGSCIPEPCCSQLLPVVFEQMLCPSHL